ncbi:glycosyltransferase [Cohnella lubricantis]|uniref:Glycosyltransferase n=1 Tax=Cohnella lubricantis TaxID=2163172 RepID=A0A841TH24_9BACL|nr:glycosyltransferase [Cohnella lubricantis]MBB6678558.1 glycosyltransferase [Cohnella lubricantis]MBP2119133.1 glycosyltransferase involved in cell wall biosynthesis [Cohnella lubricantis]
MEIAALALIALGCAAGLVLFRRNTVPRTEQASRRAERLSVIIPARNEEVNLPHLLESLQSQSCRPFEIIVVDDGSVDRTRAIAESFGVKVVEGTPLPPGWTGKNWAVWNGYQQAAGDLIAFMDTDVRLKPGTLEQLLEARERSGGAISVIPYHHTEKFYERLALITNVLSVFAFTSPFERRNPEKGLYGACILTTRDDYEQARGHESVRSEVLDDMTLGASFRRVGVPVSTYIGYGAATIRMYPNGLIGMLQGFAKSAALGAAKLTGWSIAFVALWLVGLIASETAPFVQQTSWGLPLAAGYVLYTAQLFYFMKYTGRFGIIIPVLHFLSTIFFLLMILNSAYQVTVRKRVAWKGRHVEVGGSQDR